MKRLVLTLSLLCGVLLSSPVAGATVSQAATPGYGSHIHSADIDPNAFVTALRPLTESGAEVIAQGMEDNTKAAADDLFLRFGTKTAASLAAEGRQTGYSAQAVSHVGQGVLYVYFASVYATSDQAAAAFARLKNGWAATSGSKELATLPVGDPGQSDNWAATGKVQQKDALIEEVFFRRGRILLEDFLYLYSGDVDKYGADSVKLQQEVAQSLDDIAVAQEANDTGPSPTPTPTVTSFHVNTVTVHTKGDDRSPVIHKVKAGKRIFILVDWTLKSSPPDAKPTYTFIARRSGHVVAKDAFQGGLASYPPDEYVVYTAVKLSVPGTYTIAGRVTVSGKTHRATTSFTVVK